MTESYEITVPFGSISFYNLFMIERIFNLHIGDQWRKYYRDQDAATIYIVPKQWKNWWLFWLNSSNM